MMNESEIIDNLYYWWSQELSENEREIIGKVYRPMGFSVQGKSAAEDVFLGFKQYGYKFSSGSPVNFLSGMANYLNDNEQLEFKLKLLNKAESIADSFSYSDRHFLYLAYTQLYQNLLEIRSNALNLYRYYCRKSVEIANKVREEMIKDRLTPLPSHLGYEGVFEELKEEGKYEEAIRLIIDGREKGWNIQYLISDAYNLIEEYNLNAKELGLKEEREYYTEEEINSNPYLRINLLLEKIESRNDKQKNFEKEANEILDVIEKSKLTNYIALDSFYKIGFEYYKCGEKDKALVVFNKIYTIDGISKNTVSEYFAKIGKLLIEDNKTEIGLSWLKAGMEMNPKLKVKSLIKSIEKQSK